MSTVREITIMVSRLLRMNIHFSLSLPNGIHFHLENGVDFGIYGEEIEYFYIELKN